MMDSAFHPAVALLLTGDLAGLRALLGSEPDLARRRSSCGHPTLLQMVACEAHHLSDPLGATALLVEAGAELTAPLVAAASVDARGVLVFLLDHGVPIDADTPWTPLDEALYWRHLELASLLVERGAQVGSLRATSGLGLSKDILRFFEGSCLRPGSGPILSPFMDTIPPGRARNPQDVIDNAFVMAAQNGWPDCAEALLSMGAVVNAKPPGFHWRGAALHAAVWHGDAAMVRWLVDRGADPTLRDDLVGADAVGWATHHDHLHLVPMLKRAAT